MTTTTDERRRAARQLPRVTRLGRSLAPACAILVAQMVLFPAPAGIVFRGLVVGGLTALIALGMGLVYRANRIVNFAQADLGLAPTVLAFLLIDRSGVPYPIAAAIGLATAMGMGAATERVVIRRFARSPRLLVTIATIGLSQVLAGGALLLPRLWDVSVVVGRVPAPFDASLEVGGVVFDVSDLLALVVTPIVVALVVVFLRSSDAGVAIRASADDRDRAALLGVPVERMQSLVWTLSAALAFVAVFLRAGILDVPTGTALGFGVLLRAVAALVLGRMTNLVAVASCAVALGAFELGFAWDHDPALIEPVIAVLVVAALVWRQWGPGRRGGGAREDTDASAWRSVPEVRRVPAALGRLREVRVARWGALGVLTIVATALPAVLPADQVFKASAVLVYAVLGVSLVVLTGWLGSVSLGQIGLFAVGAAVTGYGVSTWRLDLLPALAVAATVTAAVAVVVALPAGRLHGLYLAVATLAFSIATTTYLLDSDRFGWVPTGRIERAPLLGGLGAESETATYYLALVVLALVMSGMRGVRRSRFGRALVAVRDNERAATAYAVDAVRLRLAAFALSGAVAGLAGGLFLHHERALDPPSYEPVQNLVVLTMVVVGGVSSLAGAVLGALFLFGARWFLGTEWQFLASGLGVVAVLLCAPGGLAGVAYRARDRWLRAVATRRGVDVPGSAPPVPVTTTTRERSNDGPDASTEPPDDPALLRVTGLDVAYDGVPVLFGVDLDVQPGEAVALLGTNGAGKSTVLRAISGLLAPSAGTIALHGEALVGRRAHRVAALGVSLMPGGAGVFPTLTVTENLRVAGWLGRHDPVGLDTRLKRMHALFPVLVDRADEPAGNLSGGEQQMVALAMVVLVRPWLLLVDELSLGLAPAVVTELLRFVDQLRREGTTLVVVEQSVSVALEIADRAVFLERGEVRFAGPAADLLERPDLLRSVFLGQAAGDGERPADDGGGHAPVPGRADVRPPALEARGLTVAFGGLEAVRDVSLVIREREIVGLIGPNGAGKSTLFDLLGGVLQADNGRIALAGHDVTNLGAARRARRGLGRSFQDARLFPSLTVDETIAVACERWVRVPDPLSAALHLPNARDSEDAVGRRVDELVELLNLQPYRSLFVSELSTGTRRVVDLACMLAHRPSLVLLDEPAAGLAQREVEQLAPLIRRLRDDAGASVVVIDHDIPLVRAVADRVVAMDQGRVVAAGAPADVLADPAVVASYLGDDAPAAV
jgi:branched-chain amino acid transport system permease protein